MRALPLVLGLLCFASAAHAQEPQLADLGLPRAVHRRLTLILEDSATHRFNGAAQIAATDTIAGNVVAIDGPLTVAGTILGELIVIGGDVEFLPGSHVSGDVTVIGGDAGELEVADIGGTVTMYGEGFELYHRGERILAVNTRHRWGRHGEDHYWGPSWGRSTIAFRTGVNYNRVEGLPVLFGPVIQTGGMSPTRIEALGILRTGSGDVFDKDNMGYQVRLEQFIGGRAFRIGGVARSVVEPIESWNLSNLEASLATFLLHDDQRDYFEREGWGVYARYAPRKSGIDVSFGYADEDHAGRAAHDPWTLFGDDSWREQPLVGEGNTKFLHGKVQYDGRNHSDFPADGFFVSAQAMHGLRGSLSIPATATAFDSTALFNPAVPLNEKFSSGLIDVRVYRRVTRDGTLALRGVAGGSIDGKALPPQFQHALGGAGTMPGYSLFRGDCGARTVAVATQGSNSAFFPYYGCDRFALGSIEYRGGFDFDFGGNFDFWGHRDDDWDWHVDASPNWLVFFDAGQGWALGNSRQLGAVDTGVLYDVGGGVMLGDFGVYAAVPLNGKEHGLNLFVRLGARF